LSPGNTIPSAAITNTPLLTRSGNTTEIATVAGSAPATNHCAKWDANGNLVDNGSACGPGGPTTGGTNGSIQYNNGGGLGGVTISGLLKGNGSSAPTGAASGTDYAPATSGASILKGNNAGGFANAVIGTDYAPATSGSSILKGNGSGGFSNAVAGGDYAAATSGSANTPLFDNGSHGFTNGTRSGNTTSVATTSGALINGDCAKWDANGNLVDSGSVCGTGLAGSKGPVYIDVIKDYAAKGDCSTDDSTAIQNAINACSATVGCTIVLPQPTSCYLVNSTLDISKMGVTFMGGVQQGTQFSNFPMNPLIKWGGAANGTILKLGDVGSTGVTANMVQNISFSGGGVSGVTAIAIGTAGSNSAAWQQSTMSHVDIQNVLNGIVINAQGQNLRFDHVVLNNNTASAGIGIQIQPNTSTNGGDNAEFFEDMVVSGWAIGMVIGPTNVGSGPGGVFISHSDFESNTTCGIDIESSGGVNISDNYFESSGASDPTDICIGTGGGVGLPQGIQIIGNHLTSGALTAPYIRAANFYGLLVSNNQIAGSNNKTIISSGGGYISTRWYLYG
jgi:hypothetical protein